MINRFDAEYVELCKGLVNDGTWIYNERTGKKCLKTFGNVMKFDLSGGEFPLLTLRKMFTNGMVGELLGFIRGYDNAADFRKLGCNFWDANANESPDWLANPHRKGTDDLGRIYGVQARDWRGYQFVEAHPEGYEWVSSHYRQFKVDQLKYCIDNIAKGNDNRRLIVSHLNAAETDQMALWPCHMFYQFSLRGQTLDMMMYQRSCDVPLGVPTNIASYALLLRLVSQITGKIPGVFTHFLGDTHVYEDQHSNLIKVMVADSYTAPSLEINPEIRSLHDLETWVEPKDIVIVNYQHGPAIKFPFSK